MGTMINLALSINKDDYERVLYIMKGIEYCPEPSNMFTNYDNTSYVLIWEWVRYHFWYDELLLSLKKNNIKYNLSEYGEAGDSLLIYNDELPVIFYKTVFDTDRLYETLYTGLPECINPIKFIKKGEY